MTGVEVGVDTTTSSAFSPWRRPPTVTRPADGASNPTIMHIVVDLPLPFGPRKPVTCPGTTVKLRSCTAVAGP